MTLEVLTPVIEKNDPQCRIENLVILLSRILSFKLNCFFRNALEQLQIDMGIYRSLDPFSILFFRKYYSYAKNN
jgi:hypothetical protein